MKYLNLLGKLLLLSGGLLLLLTLVVYLTLIHPRDGRVADDGPATDVRGPAMSEQATAALFQNQLALQASVPLPAYEALKAQFKSTYPLYTTVDSAHFTSPYQLFVTAGSHPERLEGRYAFLLPAGASVTIAGPASGPLRMISGAFAFPAAARLHITTSERSRRPAPFELALPAPTAPLASKSFYYRNFYRFWTPDPQPVPGGEWQDIKLGLNLRQGESVTFRCESPTADSVCIVAEPSFWQPVEAAPVGGGQSNFVFIVVDTMRADALTGPQAPFLSGLVERGHRWQNCLAAGNMTSPSTNALLACRKPQALGPLGFSYGMSEADRQLYYRSQPPSFPAHLRAAGWQTAMIGNISVISEVLGSAVDHGFSEQIAIERDAYDTPQITRAAKRWLRSHGERPFFLYLHYHAPHAPYRPPFKDIFATFPGLGGLSSFPAALRWLYQAEIHYTDRYLASLYAELQALGLTSNTHILLTADHGDHHETRQFTNNEIGEAFTGTYFDHGATLYQDEVHVPLVLVSPAGPTGTSSREYVSGLDLGPTILDLAGVPVPTYCEGQSLKSQLNHAAPALPERVLGSEGFRGKALIFSQRYKYIRHYEPTQKKLFAPGSFYGRPTTIFSKEELYDLRADPGERLNLALTDPQLLATARAHYREHYGLPVTYQLVVHNPSGEGIELRAPASYDLELADASAVERSKDKKHTILRSHSKAPLVVRSRDFAGQEPEVYLGGRRLKIAKTALKLPLTLPADQLPLEEASSTALVSLGKKPLAYLQKIEDSSNFRHALFSNNPDFEQLLREWGYLNDN